MVQLLIGIYIYTYWYLKDNPSKKHKKIKGLKMAMRMRLDNLYGLELVWIIFDQLTLKKTWILEKITKNVLHD